MYCVELSWGRERTADWMLEKALFFAPCPDEPALTSSVLFGHPLRGSEVGFWHANRSFLLKARDVSAFSNSASTDSHDREDDTEGILEGSTLLNQWRRPRT